MRTKVYAVTTGSYSDYRVRVLFTTRKLAHEHAATIRADDSFYSDAEVEEFELFDAAPNRPTVLTLWGRLDTDGDIVDETNREEPEWEYGNLYGPTKAVMQARTYQAPAYGKDTLVEVRGTSRARVAKAYQDRIAAARARLVGVA